MSIVLVTGSHRGIGLRAATTLAERGHRVFAAMRDPEGRNLETNDRLLERAESDDLPLRVLALDVTRQHSVDAAVQQALSEADRLDAVISTEARTSFGITEAFSPEQLRGVLDVNLVGAFRVARAVLPRFREQGEGLLVNVGSFAGRLTLPLFGLYQASHWGLEALTESLRYELSPFGVEVVLVEPGFLSRASYQTEPRLVDDERAAAYAERLDLVRGRLEAALDAASEGPDGDSGPDRVVEALVGLVESEPGGRPLRTVVDDRLGVRALNEAVEPHRAGLLASMELEHLDRIGGRPR